MKTTVQSKKTASGHPPGPEGNRQTEREEKTKKHPRGKRTPPAKLGLEKRADLSVNLQQRNVEPQGVQETKINNRVLSNEAAADQLVKLVTRASVGHLAAGVPGQPQLVSVVGIATDVSALLARSIAPTLEMRERAKGWRWAPIFVRRTCRPATCNRNRSRLYSRWQEIRSRDAGGT